MASTTRAENCSVTRAPRADAAVPHPIDPIQLAPPFRAALDAGQNPYRDVIHPNPLGNRILADTLFPLILRDLQDRIHHPQHPAAAPTTTAAATQPTH